MYKGHDNVLHKQAKQNVHSVKDILSVRKLATTTEFIRLVSLVTNNLDDDE